MILNDLQCLKEGFSGESTDRLEKWSGDREMTRNANIVIKCILKWIEHIRRMETVKLFKKGSKLSRRRKVRGRSNVRWMDGVSQNTSYLKVRNWWSVAGDRDNWRRNLKDTRTCFGLLRRYDDYFLWIY